MFDALEEHDGKVSISDRNIIHLLFTIDIGALAKEKQELEVTPRGESGERGRSLVRHKLQVSRSSCFR